MYKPSTLGTWRWNWNMWYKRCCVLDNQQRRGRSFHLGSEKRTNEIRIWRTANILVCLEPACVENVYEEWAWGLALWAEHPRWFEREIVGGTCRLACQLHDFTEGGLEQMLVNTSFHGSGYSSRKKMGREGQDQSCSRQEATVFPSSPSQPPASIMWIHLGSAGQDRSSPITLYSPSHLCSSAYVTLLFLEGDPVAPICQTRKQALGGEVGHPFRS